MTTRTPPFDGRFVAPLLLGSLLNPLNSTMIATALVSIGRELGVGAASTAWLVAALYLTASVAQPLMGRLADLYGPRRIMLTGLGIVAVGGLVGGLSDGMGGLLLSRLLLGIGTSSAYPAALAMIRARADERGVDTPARVLASLSIAAQSSAAVGPALGGLLTALAGWRWIFFVNVPIALLGIVLALSWLPRDTRHARDATTGVRETLKGLDLTGVALFSAAITALLLFLMRLRPDPPYLLLGLAAALTIVLVMWELRHRSPFIDVRMLRTHGALTATYLRHAVTFFAIYCMLYGFTQWLEEARGLSSTVAGLLTMPMPVVAALSSTLISRGGRVRTRQALLIGTVGMVAGALALLTASSTTPVVALVVIAMLFGLPNGLNVFGNQAALYQQAPADRIGVASGLFRTFQYIGAILSASLIGLTYGARATDGALHEVAFALAGLGVLLLLSVLLGRGLRPRPNPTADEEEETHADHRP
ncbi:MFS transporter [Flindersiella endophytica]